MNLAGKMGQLRGPISSITRRRWVYHWGHRRRKSTLGKKKDSASVPRRAQVWVGWDGELLHSALESFQLPPCPSLLRSLAHEASRDARPTGAPAEGPRTGEAQGRGIGPSPSLWACLRLAAFLNQSHSSSPGSTPTPTHTGSANNLKIVPLCPF